MYQSAMQRLHNSLLRKTNVGSHCCKVLSGWETLAHNERDLLDIGQPIVAVISKPVHTTYTQHHTSAAVMDHLHKRPKEYHTHYVTSGGACAAILRIEKIGKSAFHSFGPRVYSNLAVSLVFACTA